MAQRQQYTITIRGKLRIVEPYDFEYKFQAGEWAHGQGVLDAISTGFAWARSRKELDQHVAEGRLFLRGDQVLTGEEPIFSGDEIVHRVRRVEPPVCSDPIRIFVDDGRVVVISKPASILVHPAGRYRVNSAIELLCVEHGLPRVHPAHRIDRLTSGLLLCLRNSADVGHFQRLQQAGRLLKVYLARVYGRLDQGRLKACRAAGRWTLPDAQPQQDRSEAEAEAVAGALDWVRLKRSRRTAGVSYPLPAGDQLSPMPGASPRLYPTAGLRSLWAEEHGNCPLSPDVVDVLEVPSSGSAAAAAPTAGAAAGAGGSGDSAAVGAGESTDVLVLRVRVPMRKTGKGGRCMVADPAKGKACLSLIAPISYDAASNTSVVACRPMTGRMHQLRHHLMFIGHPIVNEPLYGLVPSCDLRHVFQEADMPMSEVMEKTQPMPPPATAAPAQAAAAAAAAAAGALAPAHPADELALASLEAGTASKSAPVDDGATLMVLYGFTGFHLHAYHYASLPPEEGSSATTERKPSGSANRKAKAKAQKEQRRREKRLRRMRQLAEAGAAGGTAPATAVPSGAGQVPSEGDEQQREKHLQHESAAEGLHPFAFTVDVPAWAEDVGVAAAQASEGVQRLQRAGTWIHKVATEAAAAATADAAADAAATEAD